MNDPDSHDFTPSNSEPLLKTDSSGDGGSNRRRKTAIGAGGGSGWSGGSSHSGGGGSHGNESGSPEDSNAFFGEPVRHGHLKDIAIEALKESHSKDYTDVRDRLLRKLHLRFGEAPDTRETMADTLSSLVVSAFTVASFMPGPRSTSELNAVFPYFSAQQIRRILSIA